MESREVKEKYAVIRDASGVASLERDFEMKPIRHWTSASSHIEYPIAWQFNFPNQNIGFIFEPHADDQDGDAWS